MMMQNIETRYPMPAFTHPILSTRLLIPLGTKTWPAYSEQRMLSTKDRLWLERFKNYIRKHSADSMLNVAGLAREFYMSESTLLRQLKRLTGLTPTQYIQEIRLATARQLLENHAAESVAQVAAKVGYSDSRAFSRTFRVRFGKLPSAFFS